MDLERTAKYGIIAAIGVILISLGTFGLMEVAWADRVAGHEGKAMGTVMLVGLAGTAVTILYLFFVVGGFIDRELEARGLGTLEE